jgi:hypothetical protein
MQNPGNAFVVLISCIVGFAIVGVLLIFGASGMLRRLNKLNSAKSDREGKSPGEKKPDPWEVAGKRLNVKEDDDTPQ